MLSDVIIRWTLLKALELKKKDEYVLYCELTDVQKKLWTAFLTYREERHQNYCAMWDRHRFQNLIAHPTLLRKSLRKRRWECSKYIESLESGDADDSEALAEAQTHRQALDKVIAAIKEVKSMLHIAICNEMRTQENVDLHDVRNSGKMMVLMELMRHFHRKQEKVLIFSESTRSLGMLSACSPFKIIIAHL